MEYFCQDIFGCENSLECSKLALEWLKLILAVFAGFWAYYKWRGDADLKRSMQFQALTYRNRVDSDMLQAIYLLDDTTNDWFNKDFVGSDKEKIVDKLLFYFCYEVYLFNHHVIEKEEFQPVSYEINRALINPQLQDYLFNLQMYAKGKGIESPYKYLLKYGLKRGLLDSAFFSGKNGKNASSKFSLFYIEWLEEETIEENKKYPSLDFCNRKSWSVFRHIKDLAKSHLFSLRWAFFK